MKITISPSPCTQGQPVTICVEDPPELPCDIDLDWDPPGGPPSVTIPPGCGGCATLTTPDNASSLVASHDLAPDAHTVVAPA